MRRNFAAAAGVALAVLVGLSVAAVGCRGASKGGPGEGRADVVLESKSGSKVTGKGTFLTRGAMVTFRLDVEHAAPGTHAVHVHEKGDCTSADGSSAAGHWNPSLKAHGRWGEGEFHLGDIGNMEVGEDGRGTVILETSLWTVGTGLPNDVVGKSIIVHGGADDFTTQPTGNAGNRLACGVIKATR